MWRVYLSRSAFYALLFDKRSHGREASIGLAGMAEPKSRGLEPVGRKANDLINRVSRKNARACAIFP